MTYLLVSRLLKQRGLMKLFILKTLSLITVVSFLFSCQQANNTQNLTASTKNHSNIINGSLVTLDDKLAAHTVLVNNIIDGYVCTGTLIAKNTVVTAAHCLSKKHSQFEIIFGLNGYDLLDEGDENSSRRATKVVTHKDYAANQDAQTDQYDIGLVYFEGTLPEGFSPAQVMLSGNPVKKGSDIIVAGYGVTKVTTTDVKYKKAKKFQDAIKNGDVFCDFDVLTADFLPSCIEVKMSGDGILRKTQAPVAYTSNTEFTLDETKSGTCSGDSGGPAYMEIDNVLYLVGITSRGNLLCDDKGVYTSIAAHIDWLLTH